MADNKHKIAFLGGGNMAEAMIAGLLKSGSARRKDIVAADVSSKRRKYLKNKYGISTEPGNQEAVKGSGTVVLAVKPQVMEEVLKAVGALVVPGQLVVSIAAGITTRYIEKFLKSGVAVVRAMPNTPLLAGAGATAVCRGKFASKKHLNAAKNIFSVSGTVVETTEDRINAVTALSGSGPAYVFYMAELLKSVGVEMGLKENVADALARQTIFGAGLMLKEQDTEAQDLRRMVTSPGGTTEAALKYLHKNRFAEIFKSAVKQAKKRAGALSK